MERHFEVCSVHIVSQQHVSKAHNRFYYLAAYQSMKIGENWQHDVAQDCILDVDAVKEGAIFMYCATGMRYLKRLRQYACFCMC